MPFSPPFNLTVGVSLLDTGQDLVTGDGGQGGKGRREAVCVWGGGGREEVSEEGREGVFSVTDHWPLLNLGSRWTWTVAVGVRRDGRQKGGVEWGGGWGGW